MTDLGKVNEWYEWGLKNTTPADRNYNAYQEYHDYRLSRSEGNNYVISADRWIEVESAKTLKDFNYKGWEFNPIQDALESMRNVKKRWNEKISMEKIPLSIPSVAFTSVTKSQVFMFWNPNAADNRNLITGWKVVFKNESTGKIIISETYPPTKDNMYIRDLNSGTQYRGYVTALGLMENSPQQNKRVTTSGVKAMIIAPKVYEDFNDFIKRSGDNYDIDTLDGFIVSEEDVIAEKLELDRIRLEKERRLGGGGSFQDRGQAESEWIKEQKDVNYDKRRELNIAILSDRININKFKLQKATIPETIPEITPEIVATSSLLPLGIIALLLYSRTGRK